MPNNYMKDLKTVEYVFLVKAKGKAHNKVEKYFKKVLSDLIPKKEFLDMQLYKKTKLIPSKIEEDDGEY